MKNSRLLSVLLGALVLVLGGNLAVYAATGGAFTLGYTNKANQTTVLQNTGSGPALKLQAKGAPLAVNNSKKVAKLNADKVDGKSAAQINTRTWVYELTSIPSTTVAYVTFPGLPNGNYLVTYRAGAYFGGAGTYNLTCYFSLTSGTALGTYGARYETGGHNTCSASGVVNSADVNFFTMSGGSDAFTASGTAQWTFTRINARVNKSPSESSTIP